MSKLFFIISFAITVIIAGCEGKSSSNDASQTGEPSPNGSSSSNNNTGTDITDNNNDDDDDEDNEDSTFDIIQETSTNSSYSIISWVPRAGSDAQIIAYQTGSTPPDDCQTGSTETLDPAVSSYEFTALPPNTEYAVRLCSIIDNAVVGQATLSGVTPAQPSSATVTFTSSDTMNIIILPEQNPDHTTYAINIIYDSASSWISPAGTLHQTPQWGTYDDFGGDDGMTLDSLEPGSYTIIIRARNSAGDEISSEPIDNDTPPAASNIISAIQSSPVTYSNGVETHQTLSLAGSAPSLPLLVLWSADFQRNSDFTFGSVSFHSGATETKNINNRAWSNTGVGSAMHAQYYSSYDISHDLTIQANPPTGQSMAINQSSIFAFDLTSTSVYVSPEGACGGKPATDNGAVNSACTFSIPGNKSGQTWLFFIRTRATATAMTSGFYFNTTLKFDGQNIGRPSSQSVGYYYPMDIMLPYVHTFSDNDGKNLQLDYYASTYDSNQDNHLFEVTVFGMQLDNHGTLIDYDYRNTTYPAHNSTNWQTVHTKSVNFPEEGNYLVFNYLGVETPDYFSRVRTSIGDANTHEYNLLGGGSGVTPYISSVAIYNETDPGDKNVTLSFKPSDTGGSFGVLESATVVIKLNP